jgi:hypothetical protein
MDMTSTKTITWTNSQNVPMEVTITLTVITDTTNDDLLGVVTGQVAAYITYGCKANGVAYDRLCTAELIQHPIAAAKIGNILLTAARYAEIKAAEAELAASSAYVAYRAEIKAASQVAADAETSANRLESTMTLNGRTF